MWTVAARSDNCNGRIIDFIFIVTGICFMIWANHSQEIRNIDQQKVAKQNNRAFEMMA